MLKEDIENLREPTADMFFGGPQWSVGEEMNGRKDMVGGASIVGEWTGDWKGPIVSVKASPTHLSTFYVLSALGELATHKLEVKGLESHALHRYSPESPEHEIETHLYTRDMSSALSAVTNLSKSAQQSGRLIALTEQEMIDLVTPVPPIEDSSWSTPPLSGKEEVLKLREGGEEMVRRFREEVADWRRRLPPGLGDTKAWSEMIPSKEQNEFELVTFRLQLLIDVVMGKWEQVVASEKRITKGMSTDPSFMSPVSLKLLIAAVIPNDHLKGLQLGLKFCEIVVDTPSRSFKRWLPESGFSEAENGKKPSSDENLASIPAATFNPASALLQRQNLVRQWVERKTIAAGGVAKDRTEAVSRLKSVVTKESSEEREGGPAGIDEKKDAALKGAVEKTKKCLDMINLDIRIHKAISNAQRASDETTVSQMPTIMAEDVIRLVHAFEISDSLLKMDPQKGGAKVQRTISAYTNRMFLDALLATAAFDEYFSVAVELSVTYYSFPFGRNLLRQMTREGLPRLRAYTDDLYSKANAQISQSLNGNNPNLMNGVKILKDALLKMIRATLGIANGLSVASGKERGADKAAVEGVKKVVEGMTQHLGEAAQVVFDPIKDLTRESVQFLNTSSQNSASIIMDIVNETNSMLERLSKIIKDIQLGPGAGAAANP
ncbi:hypothetical protein HK097_010584 [Rhizophlyctis rosea]|uniref:Uncharacterized protein n=1 Tax=Rhizophlyctis rosea TaxID=64517 RepID=A0AAD5SKV0_9FUNG|nr:hypothetical protein HK097_010584 [Rhizophlyctis rosea]